MYYHATHRTNLLAILVDGLLPSIGPLSSRFGEIQPRVYLFTSAEACETGLSNWLGDELEALAGDDLVIIEIKPDGIIGASEAEYELACPHSIAPTQILRVLGDDLNEITCISASLPPSGTTSLL